MKKLFQRARSAILLCASGLLLAACGGEKAEKNGTPGLTKVGPTDTGISDRTGVAINRPNAKIMAVDSPQLNTGAITIQAVTTTAMVPERLAGGAMYQFSGISSNALSVIDLSSSVTDVYECDAALTRCMALPSAVRLSNGKLVFPIKSDMLYGIELE